MNLVSENNSRFFFCSPNEALLTLQFADKVEQTVLYPAGISNYFRLTAGNVAIKDINNTSGYISRVPSVLPIALTFTTKLYSKARINFQVPIHGGGSLTMLRTRRQLRQFRSDLSILKCVGASPDDYLIALYPGIYQDPMDLEKICVNYLSSQYLGSYPIILHFTTIAQWREFRLFLPNFNPSTLLVCFLYDRSNAKELSKYIKNDIPNAVIIESFGQAADLLGVLNDCVLSKYDFFLNLDFAYSYGLFRYDRFAKLFTRRALVDLFGDSCQISRIRSVFEGDHSIGVVGPLTHRSAINCRAETDSEENHLAQEDFYASHMFWMRSAAVQPPSMPQQPAFGSSSPMSSGAFSQLLLSMARHANYLLADIPPVGEERIPQRSRALNEDSGLRLCDQTFNSAGFLGRPEGYDIKALKTGSTNFEGQRVCLFCAYVEGGTLRNGVKQYLTALKQSGFKTVLIAALDRNLAFQVDFDELDADIVLVRDNVGFDFAAWAHCMKHYSSLWNAAQIVFANDSMLPVAGMSQFLSRFSHSHSSIIAATDSFYCRHHFQSYLFSIDQYALKNKTVRRTFDSIRVWREKSDVISRYELTFYKIFQNAGLSIKILFPVGNFARPDDDIELLSTPHHKYRELIACGFPLIKRQYAPSINATLNNNKGAIK